MLCTKYLVRFILVKKLSEGKVSGRLSLLKAISSSSTIESVRYDGKVPTSEGFLNRICQGEGYNMRRSCRLRRTIVDSNFGESVPNFCD
jgi:hypothetical protein